MKKVLTLALALILVFTSLALPANVQADSIPQQSVSIQGLTSQETPLQISAPQDNPLSADQAAQSELLQLPQDMTLFEPSLTAEDLPGTMTMAQAAQRNHIARLYNEEEDLNTVIFLNEDGTKSMYQYAAPVKFEKDGNVFDKSNKIIASGLTGYSYKNKSNDVDVFFADEIGSSGNKGVRIINDDINIELIPVVSLPGAGLPVVGDELQNQISQPDSDTSQNITTDEVQASQETVNETDGTDTSHASDSLDQTAAVIEPAPSERKIASALAEATTAAADSVVYNKVFSNGTDIRYTPTFNGFKEDIILNAYEGINTFGFVLNTNGLAMLQIAGNWYLAEPGSTEPLVSLGEIYVYDSCTGQRTVESDTWEHETYNNSYGVETVTENQSYRITVTVDSAFLQSESTIYPVTVDPSFTITSGYIQDTMISQGNPNTNYGSYQDVRMGYGSTFQSTRILVDFTSYAQSAPDFYTLSFSSAEYYMYCSSSYSSTPYVDTYMVAARNTSDPKMWNHTTATWNNSATNTMSGATLVSSRTVSGSGWYSFDISSAYYTWLAMGFANSNGFLIKMRDETAASNYWRIFHSANYTDSTKTPYLLVKYNEVTDIKLSATNLTMYPGETYQLTWSVSPVTADYTFSFGHSHPLVVTMSSSGLITAHSAGSGGIQLYITCTSTGKLYILPVNVTVNSGTPPVWMGTYHIFNTNSCKPVTVRNGGATSGSQVWQENYKASIAAYQKWDVIRLSNGRYVIRANHSKNYALSNLNSSIALQWAGSTDDPASIPTHAQWNIVSSSSGLYLSPQSQPSLFLQPYNNSVWAGETLECTYMNTGAYFRFIKPSDYVPTTGVTLTAVYLLKNGTYTYTPTVTPSNATFKDRAMWSWEGRSSNGTQLVTMPGYAWGQATTNVNSGTIKAHGEGTAWVKMYCPDTNISHTANVQVHFLEEGKEYYVKNRSSGKQLSAAGQTTVSSQIWQEGGKNSHSKRFSFESADKTTPYLYIKHLHSGLYLGVENNSAEHDAKLKIASKNVSADGQKFKITRTTDNYFQIMPKTGESGSPQRVLSPINTLLNGDQICQRNIGVSNLDEEWEFIKKLYPSGSEIAYNPDLWNNNSDIKDNTNCYSYAFNNQTERMEPGMYSAFKEYVELNLPLPLELVYQSAAALRSYLESDAEELGVVFEPIDRSQFSSCPSGSYIIAVVLAVDVDYHFYRQNPDGTWSHKRGATNVMNTDADSNIIYDPEYANRNYSLFVNYSEFVGFYRVTPINNIYSASNGIATASVTTQKEYLSFEPDKSVLPTLEDVNSISAGMTYAEITQKIGLPQESMTSGLLSADYYLDNDQIARIYYYYNNSGTLISSRIKLLGE